MVISLPPQMTPLPDIKHAPESMADVEDETRSLGP